MAATSTTSRHAHVPDVGHLGEQRGFRRRDDYNEADTYGARAALKIDLSDNWSITPTVMAQEQKANGVCSPVIRSIGDLKVAHYHPESSERPLDAGRADRRRQDQQLRHHVRRLLSQARRRHGVRLLGLLVLLRPLPRIPAVITTTATISTTMRAS